MAKRDVEVSEYNVFLDVMGANNATVRELLTASTNG